MRACDYLEVPDVVKSRIESSCKSCGLEVQLITKFSNRPIDRFIYTVLCKGVEGDYSIWAYNSSTYLLFNEVKVENLKEAFYLLGDRFI
jgi:hypothetical protein